MKARKKGWRKIQFDAPPALDRAIKTLMKSMDTTASFVVRTGLTLFMQERGLVEQGTDALPKFINPDWKPGRKTKTRRAKSPAQN